ncbi:hypothetical protein Tco_0247551 [Tanacetum coccineum]
MPLKDERTRSAGRSDGRTKLGSDDQGGDHGNRLNGGLMNSYDFSNGYRPQFARPTILQIIAQGDVRNVNVNNSRSGCPYKEFLACNPKDFDGNGGAISYTRWTEKMELVQDMSGCGDH